MKLNQLLMKRKSYFLAFAFSLIALSSLAQIDIDEPVNENNKSKTQGFFRAQFGGINISRRKRKRKRKTDADADVDADATYCRRTV